MTLLLLACFGGGKISLIVGWRWLGAQTPAARCPVFDGLSNFPLGLMSYSIVKSVFGLFVSEAFKQKQIQGLALQHTTLPQYQPAARVSHIRAHVWHVI